MSEPKDPAFKLFGTTIPVPPPIEITVSSVARDEEKEERETDASDKKATETKERNQRPAISLELTEPPTTSPATVPPSVVDKEDDTEETSELSISQEKTQKKPDKILPCPRCNSQDTKFCYYNNYNVNQPRHFCKNCQRYWTAGGTMRNVPVGAGRRKSKNMPLPYRHITVPNTLQTGRTDQTESVYHPSMKPNGTSLAFISDSPLCESIASVLNLADKTVRNCTKHGFIRTEEQRVPVSCGENGDENSSGSSVTALDSFEEGKRTNPQNPAIQSCPRFSPQVPSFTHPPWIYPYNSAQWRPPLVPPPPFCAPTFPVSFYPTTGYWGCAIPGAWSGIPWVSPQPSSPNFGSSGSGSDSLNLGKHSRDGNMLKQSNSEREDTIRESDSERCLWIPKTLRIDDQGEAVRSSTWATLGTKYDKADVMGGGGFYKSFDSKAEKNTTTAETSPAWHRNPAALSRSLNFHERS